MKHENNLIYLSKLFGLSKRDAAIEVLTMYYEAAGFERKAICAELDEMNDTNIFKIFSEIC